MTTTLRQAQGQRTVPTLRQGFTLIEMLVVVAVIGILSSVLLTGLGPARNKAKDSRIVTEVNQARSIAATLDNNGFAALPEIESFDVIDDTFKESYPELAALAIDISAQGGELIVLKSTDPYFRAYLIYSKLNIQAGTPPNAEPNYYCVDSIGRAGFFTGLPDLIPSDLTEPDNLRCPLPF